MPANPLKSNWELILALACVLAVAGFSFFYVEKLRQRVVIERGMHQAAAAQRDEAKRLRQSAIDSFIGAEQAEMTHFQQVPRMMPLEPLLPDMAPLDLNQSGYHLIIAVSESSCDVCQDDLTQFANRVADAGTGIRVAAVVQAGSKVFAHRYMTNNQIAFPLYYDADGGFMQINRMAQAPAFLLLKDGLIITAHYPMASFPKRSQAHYRALLESIKNAGWPDLKQTP